MSPVEATLPLAFGIDQRLTELDRVVGATLLPKIAIALVATRVVASAMTGAVIKFVSLALTGARECSMHA